MSSWNKLSRRRDLMKYTVQEEKAHKMEHVKYCRRRAHEISCLGGG
jgi:hypothetical protein